MNIIITLPINLVADIAEGRKQVEIRKSIPKDFNTDNDIVWVKTKGYDKIAICFEISHFEEETDLKAVWQKYHAQLGINQLWWENYVRSTPKLAIWHIKQVHIFQPNLSFSEIFPDKTAPQSYIYTYKGLIPTRHRTTKKDFRKTNAEIGR